MTKENTNIPTVGEILNFVLLAFNISLPTETHYGKLTRKEVERFRKRRNQHKETTSKVEWKIIHAICDSLNDNKLFHTICNFCQQYRETIISINTFDFSEKEILYFILKHFIIPFIALNTKSYNPQALTFNPQNNSYTDCYSFFWGNFWYLPLKNDSGKIILPHQTNILQILELSNQSMASIGTKIDSIKSQEKTRALRKQVIEGVIPTRKKIKELSKLDLPYKDIYAANSRQSWIELSKKEKVNIIKNHLEKNGVLQYRQSIEYYTFVETEIIGRIFGDNSKYLKDKIIIQIYQNNDLNSIINEIQSNVELREVNPISTAKYLAILNNARYNKIRNKLLKEYEITDEEIVNRHLDFIEILIKNNHKPSPDIIETILYWSCAVSFVYKKAESFFGRENAYELIVYFKNYFNAPIVPQCTSDGFLDLFSLIHPQLDVEMCRKKIEHELLKLKVHSIKN